MASSNPDLLSSGVNASVILYTIVQSAKHHPPCYINAVRWNCIGFNIYLPWKTGYFIVVYDSKSKVFFFNLILCLYMLK